MGGDPGRRGLSTRGLTQRARNPPAQQRHESHESTTSTIGQAAFRHRMKPRRIGALQVGEAIFHQSLQFQPIAFGKLHGTARRALRHFRKLGAISRRRIGQKPREQGLHLRLRQWEKIQPAAAAANGGQKPRGG